MYQFIRVNSYSSSGSKKSASTANVKSIVGEAARLAGYIKHLVQPATPTMLFGCSPTAAGDAAEAWGKRNKIRKDGHVLLAGVISVPSEFQHWQQYKADCIDWLQEKYGGRLKSIVEHTDEDHPHLHFYAVPLDGERFDALHQGEKARNELRALKQRTGAQNKAYRKAMKLFQCQFHAEVSVNYGLSKDGPKKTRKTRAVYLSEREAASIVAVAKSTSAEIVSDAETQYAELKTEAQRQMRLVNEKITRQIEDAHRKAAAIAPAAEKRGFAAGQERFERMPLVKKMRAVFHRVVMAINKQMEQLKTELVSTKTKANAAILNYRAIIVKKNETIAEKEEQIAHVNKVCAELANEKRNLQREARRMPQLAFANESNYITTDQPKI